MSNVIGKVIATEKNPSTIDYFYFWTNQDLILNPFDVVKVSHLNDSISFGVVEEISHITDTANFMTDYISSDFGDVDVEDYTNRIGMNYVKAKIVGNDANVYIPLINNSKVELANEKEIIEALGLKNISNPVTCGCMEMYSGHKNKISIPIQMDSRFLIGPEGAHLNISGISGLAAKTSYAMFLLKSIQDRCLYDDSLAEDEDVAFVLFNVKGKDLLAIDEPNDFDGDENEKNKVLEMYKSLGLSTEPFKNVKYYYPYNDANSGITFLDKETFDEQVTMNKAKLYKYPYSEDKDNLDLLFASIDDPNQTMESIINYIINNQGKFKGINDWEDFLDTVKEYADTGSPGKDIMVNSWRKFNRLVRKSIYRNHLFSDVTNGTIETRIEDSIKYIKKNEIHVIDIANLDDSMQGFVFGNTIRSIYDLKLGKYSDEEDPLINPPKRIIVFVDELNKYASTDTPKTSPILRQILDVAERGRSLGVVLFSAEQFRSAIHPRVTGNCSTHAYSRTNAIEIAKADYKYIPSVYKNMMTRLKQGEYIIQNPIFRSLMKIKFPKPIYKQYK